MAFIVTFVGPLYRIWRFLSKALISLLLLMTGPRLLQLISTSEMRFHFFFFLKKSNNLPWTYIILKIWMKLLRISRLWFSSYSIISSCFLNPARTENHRPPTPLTRQSVKLEIKILVLKLHLSPGRRYSELLISTTLYIR